MSTFLVLLSSIKGQRQTKYTRFYSHFTRFFILNTLNLIANNSSTVHGTNLGVLINILVMVIALSDRIRLIQKSKEEADSMIILQLKETAVLKSN